MRAEEFRTGNLILRIGNLHEVDWGTIKICAQRNKQFNEDFKPVQLTDEWLEKMGFHKDGAYYKIGVNDMNYCLLFRDWASNYAAYVEYTDSPDPRDFKAMYPISFDITYVHQLQNLYFALTGQELNFVTP